MINSYYGILGIKKISNKKEIISAFRRLARKYHPDVNSKNSYNEKKFKEINEAYQVLSDEKSIWPDRFDIDIKKTPFLSNILSSVTSISS